MLKKKSLLIICLAIFAAIFSILSVGMYNANGVSADQSTTTSIDDVDFAIEDGASLKTRAFDADNARNEDIGLRFKIFMDLDEYRDLEVSSLYKSVNYGILIAPASYSLTFENVFGDSAIYDWAGANGVYTDQGKTRILNFISHNLGEDSANSEAFFYSAIMDLKATHMLTEFTAVGYIKAVQTDDEVVYRMTNPVGRNIVYVAQKAIEDESDGAVSGAIKDWMKENYLETAVTYAESKGITSYYQNGELFELGGKNNKSFLSTTEITSNEQFLEVVARYNEGYYTNIKLKTDVTVELTQDAFNKAVFNELCTTFDGDGHTVNIICTGNFLNVYQAGCQHNYNFAKVIDKSGLIKNANSYSVVQLNIPVGLREWEIFVELLSFR